jgi:branched-chain amino acid transport system permease protein
MGGQWVQFLASGLTVGSIYALVALGFSLVFSVGRFFHFGLAATYTICAYTAFGLIASLGLTPWIAVPLAVAVAATTGCIFELLVFHPLASRRATMLTMLLSSLGLVIACQSAVALGFGNQTKVLRPSVGVISMNFLGGRITQTQLAGMMIALAMFGLIWLSTHKSKMGLIFRATAGDAELARIRGVDVRLIRLIVFGVGSGIVGMAALISAYDTDLVPTMGFNALLPGVTAAVAGGIGSRRGALAGGLTIGLAQHFGVLALPTEWQDAIVFMILLIFLLLKPQGFFGKGFKRAV